jgi:DNA polymerase III psi subunit
MSLNDIQLQPYLLADLYSDVLIETNTAGTAVNTPESKPMKYLGKNEKNILIIVANAEVPFLPDTELSLLTNILSACRLSLADIAIINSYNIDHTELHNSIQQLEARSIILFGTDPLSIGLPINFPQFQLQQFDKRIYLYGPALSELEQDKSLKTRLWGCLKQLFGL